MLQADQKKPRRGDTGVNTFVVRRPIFDRRRTVAYQLLARDELTGFFPTLDLDGITKSEWDDAWASSQLSALTRSKRTCITFTPDLLALGYPRMFAPGSVVINLPLDDIEGRDDLLEACRSFRSMGHPIAVEDPHRWPGLEPFISLADIVKLSFQDEDDVTRTCGHVRRIVGDRPRLMAGQVDSGSDYRQALELKFDLFQGDFFTEPRATDHQPLRGNRLNYFKLLEAANQPDQSIDELDTIISSDLTITHRLLKYLGAAAFGFRAHVSSVRHGLALLGERRIRSFVSVVALVGLCDDKPNELLVTAAIRGKFCELIGDDVVLGDRKAELFLLGALSLLDAMVDQTMPDAIKTLPLDEELRSTLLGGSTRLSAVLDFARRYEKADWKACTELGPTAGIAEHRVLDHYTKAVSWASETLGVF